MNYSEISLEPANKPMRIAYDRAGDILAVELGSVRESAGARELAPGVYLDMTEDGKVLALEIVGASRMYSRETLESLEPSAYGPMSLLEASLIAGLTPIALRKACERGRLTAKKVGRDWMVTEEALNAYLGSRRQSKVAERAGTITYRSGP